MPFSINKKNLAIKARRGDSGSIVFEFNIPIDGFNVDFCVAKKTDTSSLDDVIISKCYTNATGHLLEVCLTSEDTEKLSTGEGFIGQYYWSLKIHNDYGFSSTLIPYKFNRTPKFFVYPKIGECENE